MDAPKIALAIILENGGFGAEAAAPIARKVLDYYLLGKRPVDKDKQLAEKGEAGDTHAVATFKAEEESIGGPQPGAETRGNKD